MRWLFIVIILVGTFSFANKGEELTNMWTPRGEEEAVKKLENKNDSKKLIPEKFAVVKDEYKEMPSTQLPEIHEEQKEFAKPLKDTNYGYGERIEPTPIEEKEGGSFKDYATVYNVFGMSAYNPQTNMTNEDMINTWDMKRKKEIFDTLKTVQDYELLNTSLNEGHYKKMLMRRNLARQADERINNDTIFMQMLGAVGLSLLDPAILLPGILAFKGINSTTIALKRITYGVGAGAAITSVQELILSVTNARLSDITSAAFYGGIIGGGLFAFGPAITAGRRALSSKVAKKTATKKNIGYNQKIIVNGIKMDNLKVSKLIGIAIGYIFVIIFFWITPSGNIDADYSKFHDFIEMLGIFELHREVEMPARIGGIISLALPWIFREKLGEFVRIFYKKV